MFPSINPVFIPNSTRNLSNSSIRYILSFMKSLIVVFDGFLQLSRNWHVSSLFFHQFSSFLQLVISIICPKLMKGSISPVLYIRLGPGRAFLSFLNSTGRISLKISNRILTVKTIWFLSKFEPTSFKIKQVWLSNPILIHSFLLSVIFKINNN